VPGTKDTDRGFDYVSYIGKQSEKKLPHNKEASMKRMVLGAVMVFLAWSILDFLIHGVILQASYAATMDLWRPEAEMKMGIISLVALISAIAFVSIYKLLYGQKDIMKGLKYGIWFGIAVGVGVRNICCNADSLFYGTDMVPGHGGRRGCGGTDRWFGWPE
jgi:hypothetical protein